MDRRLRAFQPTALPLEGRILLARVQAPPPVSHPQVSVNDEVTFNTGLGLDSAEGTQQVAQQAGEATIRLRRGYPGDTVYVQVATDPSSPAVGVNLPAVNQMVMFADGQTNASVTFPINAGAPNPGEVDVNLTITPIDPPPLLGAGGPLELRIMAPDATTPPKIIEVDGTPQGIKLTFSKPMNPVQASNMHNYTVRSSWTTTSVNDGFLDSTPIGWLSPDAPLGGTKTTHGAKLVALRSANYDPADFTVTLIPKHKLSYSPTGSIVVTPGTPAKASLRLRDGSSSAQGLTDLEGNAISQGGKPGEFSIHVYSGNTALA